jgi:hypothetical protein
VFDGEEIHLDRVEFTRFNLNRAVFSASVVRFNDAVFNLEEHEGEDGSTVDFRDSNFCVRDGKEGGRRVEFDHARLCGATSQISFEDAHIQKATLSFANVDFSKAKVDFYQTIFLGTEVLFTQSVLQNSELHFADSRGGGVLLCDIAEVPRCDFSFRHAESLRVENSTLARPMKVASVKTVSLLGTSIVGSVICVASESGQGRKEDHGRSGKNKFWFLDALENLREDKPAPTEEFAATKEVFHAMGEYLLEDEAYVRYMRHRAFGRRRGVRGVYAVLNAVGRFGTSPGRVGGFLIGTFGLAYLINVISLCSHPEWFKGTVDCIWLDAVAYTWSAFIQLGGPLSATNLASMILLLAEATFGWFVFGYFLT